MKYIKKFESNNEMITPRFSFNTSWLGNPSFDIYIEWNNPNEKVPMESRYPRDQEGKYYIKKIFSLETHNKWFNIDKLESKLKKAFDDLYTTYPYLTKSRTEKDYIETIKKDFEGLYYTNSDLPEYKIKYPKMLLDD